MLEPQETELTIFLNKGWSHAVTKLRPNGSTKGAKLKHVVTGLVPRIDEKTLILTYDGKQDLVESLSVQKASENILELSKAEKPRLVVDVSTDQVAKTLTGVYVHDNYNALTLMEESGALVQIPKTSIRFMRVMYDNNKVMPEMLSSSSVHVKMAMAQKARWVSDTSAQLEYFFDGLEAQVTHVFQVDSMLSNVSVSSYLNVAMREPAHKLDNVKIWLVEDYREQMDPSREQEAPAQYAYSDATQASPAVYARGRRNVVKSKAVAYKGEQASDSDSVHQNMQQVMDVNTEKSRAVLESGRESIFPMGTHELKSAKVVFRLEKSGFSFLQFPNYKEQMQSLDARISWDKQEEVGLVIFSGAARFYASGVPLGVDSVGFTPWKLGNEMTIDFPLSGFVFARRLLHSVFNNQQGGTTKKVFRVDMFVSQHRLLEPEQVLFESLENLGEGVKEIKFLRRVTDVIALGLQASLDAGNAIDPYSPGKNADQEGKIEQYMNPETGLYESGVYRLSSTAKHLNDIDSVGSVSHFFYEVIY